MRVSCLSLKCYIFLIYIYYTHIKVISIHIYKSMTLSKFYRNCSDSFGFDKNIYF